MAESIQTKRCPKCKHFKPLSEFYKDIMRGDGHYNLCKICHRKNVKKYQELDKTKWLQYSKQNNQNYRKTLPGYVRALWHRMLHRCNNLKDVNYKYYGGRGIKVKFASFEDFYDYVVNDLKADPRGLTIDRINNDGHYEKGNIRFLSHSDNCKNRMKRPKIAV